MKARFKDNKDKQVNMTDPRAYQKDGKTRDSDENEEFLSFL